MTKEDLKITTFQDNEGYVFISYCSVDEDVVFNDYVVPLQEKYGLRVFCDKNFKNRAAQVWTKQMRDNIREADAVLIFISKDYVASYACLLEVLVATFYKKPILKIQINEPEKCTDYKTRAISPTTKAEYIRVGKQLENNNEGQAYNCYLEIEDAINAGEIDKYTVSSSFTDYLSKISVTKLNLNDGISAVVSSLNEAVKRVVFAEPSKKTSVDSVKPAETNKSKRGRKPKAETNPIVEPNSVKPILAADGEIASKSDAIMFLEKKGISVSDTLTYASFNDKGKGYWANAKIENLDKDWSLIFNNKETGKLVALRVPAKTLKLSDEPGKGLKIRPDKSHLIDLLVNDEYIDKKSKVDFAPYVVGEFYYSTDVSNVASAKKETEKKGTRTKTAKTVTNIKGSTDLKSAGNLVRYLGAFAMEHDGVITVLKNSAIKMRTAPSCPNRGKKDREEALLSGKLKEKNGEYILLEDITFPSRSAAACFVAGLSVSGNNSWS